MRRSIRLALLASSLALLGTAATAQAQLRLPRTDGPGLAQPQADVLEAPVVEKTAADKATADKQAAATAAAASWLQMLDKRDWRNAWQAASQMFRTAVPINAWMEGIPKAREPLGALTERTPADAVYKTTLEGRPDGEYVTVSFTTKYANKPEAEEVVTTVREADGKWRVTGFQAR